MSCRETSSGSAITTYARLYTGRTISEPATLSTFHYLRNLYLSRDPEDRTVYTQNDYDAFLERSIDRVESARDFTDRQRDSLLRRLRQAQSEPMPDQATVYALRNITPTLRERSTALSRFIRTVSSATGESYDTVRERFNTLSSGVTRRNAVDFNDTGREQAANLGLPRDPGTVHAIRQLTSEMRHAEAARARLAHQRVVRQPVAFDLQQTGVAGLSVTEWGYDPRNGRLEVNIRDSVMGEDMVYAYRNVPQDVADAMAQAPGSNWYALVRGNTDFAYEDEVAAALDGAAPRCSQCGQWANSQHQCPAQTQPQPTAAPTTRAQRMSRYYGSGRWTRQKYEYYYVDAQGALREGETSAYLPPIRRLQEAVRSGPLEVEMDYVAVNLHEETIEGNIQMRRGALGGYATLSLDEDRALVIDTSNLRCSCPQYRANGNCSHINAGTQMLRDRYERPNAATLAGRRRIAQQEALDAAATRVERMREAAIATDWMRNPAAAAEAQRSWREDAEVLYSENPQAFQEDIQNALERAAAKNGSPDIPYMSENALDGLCTRESGKGFGVEIEYEFPANMSYADREQAQRNIGEALYAAGLTYDRHMQPYRASQRRGVRHTHRDENGVGNWSWERDGSVEGELVTPIMYDEPETWERLETALRILRDNGAVAGTRAGAHVHVGTADYEGNPAVYAELSRMVVQHEDVIARLASNPSRGTHRNNGYSRPTPSVPPSGFSDISSVREWQRPVGRYAMLNLEGVRGGAEDHPEFRIFDSTLDPGAVQTQIKMAVGMAEAAKRNAAAGGTERDREPWGANFVKTQGQDPAVTPEAMTENSATTRSFIDMLFRRREDKAQIATVFAHTRWTASAH